MSKKSTIFKYILLSTLLLMTTACAGPSTPFGALSPFATKTNTTLSEDNTYGGVEIEITPKNLRYHKRANVKVHIKDPEGITSNAQYQVLYNKRDVTDSFKLMKPRSKEPRELVLVYNKLKLPARKVPLIEVLYRRSQGDARQYRASMKNPDCDHKATRAIASTLNFDVPAETIRDLEEVSFNHEINPSMLAALAAQESGFNPKAVSWYRAIGLTQVTHIAEKEILKDVQDWPRYPGIQKLGFSKLKYKILRNEINENNEWRLDPRLSIEGGAKYFKYLEKYWAREDKQLLLAKSGGDLTRLMLASYNIGPGSVTRSIQRKGPEWLKDKEGVTSAKYVNLVTSYCEEFGSGGKE